MEPFYSLLVVMGLNSAAAGKEPFKMDILSKIPVEIAFIILRQLEPKSLLAAALVSRRWLRLCRSDTVLRSRVRRQLRKERRERIDPRGSRRTVLRDTQVEARPFAPRNGQFHVQRPAQQAHPMHASSFWTEAKMQVRMLGQNTAVPTSRPQRNAKARASSPKAIPCRRMRL